jgi:AbrB family looped-hinge helix DNA binding protein
MASVTVNKKFQVVIPRGVREKIGVAVGDILEARVERGKITFRPKSALERGIEESLEDFRQGRFYGPFDSIEATIASLKSEIRKRAARRGSAA